MNDSLRELLRREQGAMRTFAAALGAALIAIPVVLICLVFID